MTDIPHTNFVNCHCKFCENRRKQLAVPIAMIKPGEIGQILTEIDGVPQWVKPHDNEGL